MKHLVMSEIYAHYPEVEILECEDYTAKLPYGLPGGDWDLWGGVYKLTREDAYPIKTYVDFGLEKDPKEEFKVDPMVPFLEYMGQIGPDEQLWLQYLLYPMKAAEWQEPVKKLRDTLSHREDPTEDRVNFAKQSLTPGERDIVASIERRMGKLAFATGIRVLYMTKKGAFKPVNVIPLLGLYRNVNSEEGNQIAFTQSTTYDQSWEDPTGRRAEQLRAQFWREYRKRGWFFFPFRRKNMIFTTEELATLYHFPGSVASTPNLQRIGSKKAEAPMNLPI